MTSRPTRLGVVLLLTTAALPVFASDFVDRATAGDRLLAQKQFDAAAAAFQQLVTTYPKEWMAYNGLAMALAGQGHYEEAIAQDTKGLEVSPKNWVLLSNRGRYEQTVGRDDAALEDLTASLAVHELPLSRLSRAILYFNKNRDDEALADLNKAIASKKPAAPDVTWAWRGDVYFAMEKYAEAVQDYEHYLPTVPYDVREGRAGYAYVKLGQPDRARAMTARLIDVDPRLEAYFGGDHALELYDFDARRAATSESIAAAGDAEAAGQWDRAFREWMRAYGHMLGYTKDDQAQVTQVRQGLLRAYMKLAAKPEIPEAARRFKVQAGAAVREKNYAKAEDLYRKADCVAPYDPDCYYNRALILAELNRKPEAIVSMKNYLLLMPNAPDARAAQDKIYEWGG